MKFYGYSREEWLDVVPVLLSRRLKIRARFIRVCGSFVYMLLPAQVPPNSQIISDAEFLQILPLPCRHTFRLIIADRRRYAG